MHQSRGASLIEIIVAVGVFTTILVSLGMITNAGYEQYWIASGSLEVQKAALTGTQLMVKELTQTNMASVEVSDPDPRPDPTVPVFDTLVFAQPEDLAGQRHYSALGVLQWHSFVAYYTEDVNGVRSLIRKVTNNPSPTVQVPVPSLNGADIVSMQALPSPRMMLAGVGSLDFIKKEDLVQLELTGVFEQRGTFSITVRNQAFPRN